MVEYVILNPVLKNTVKRYLSITSNVCAIGPKAFRPIAQTLLNA